MVKAPVTSGDSWGLHQKASTKDRKGRSMMSFHGRYARLLCVPGADLGHSVAQFDIMFLSSYVGLLTRRFLSTNENTELKQLDLALFQNSSLRKVGP